MAISVYPTAGYNSFISHTDAATYFGDRLNSGDFLDAGPAAQDQALVTALRALQELDVTLDLTDAAQLKAIKEAQCEQALHELRADVEEPIPFLQVSGIQFNRKPLERFSDRALGILKPYLSAPVLTRVR